MEILFGFVIGVLFVALVFGLTSVSAVLLMWAWNIVMPLLWAAAPVLTFWPAFALVILIGFASRIFSSVNINSKKD